MTNIDWQPFSDFVNTLRQSTEPKVLVGKLLEGLVQILGVSRGLVLIKDSRNSALVPVVTHIGKNDSSSVDELTELSRTIAQRAIDTDSIVFADGSVDEKWFSAASAASHALLPRRIVCAPLKAEGRLYGVVYLDGKVGSRLNDDCLPFVKVITGLASELIGAAESRRLLLNAKTKLARLNEIHLGDESFILGDSKKAQELDELIDAASAQDVSVLITGETGTGKEMVARELHRRSGRRHKAFVPVNCSALSPEIIEAELFGVEKGAYTGATERRAGRFEIANGGTLFLDEIGELAPSVQVKLLRVLQERVVTPVGGSSARLLDIRFLFATNRNLEQEVLEGNFRQDMYFRINVFPIELPALRDCPSDIEGLADFFLGHFVSRFGKKIKGFSLAARKLLKNYSWPGNIRELRNVLERATIIESSDKISTESLRLLPASASPVSHNQLSKFIEVLPDNYEDMRDKVDRLYFKMRIERCEGNISKFIRESGINRNTLYRRMNKLGIDLGKEE